MCSTKTWCDARNETLLLASAPSPAATTIQSGTQRRKYPARQSSDAMVRGVPAKDSQSSHLCPGHHLRQVGEGLEASTTSYGFERAARRPLPVATCRAQLQQAPKPQIASRVKQRGRWAADSSVRPYEAHARISQEFHVLPLELQKRCVATEAKLHVEAPKFFKT